MEKDIVLETSQLSKITPKRLFFLAHKEDQEAANYFHHEWLIYDNVSPEMEKYVFYFNVSRQRRQCGN